MMVAGPRGAVVRTVREQHLIYQGAGPMREVREPAVEVEPEGAEDFLAPLRTNPVGIPLEPFQPVAQRERVVIAHVLDVNEVKLPMVAFDRPEDLAEGRIVVSGKHIFLEPRIGYRRGVGGGRRARPRRHRYRCPAAARALARTRSAPGKY